MIEWMDHKIKRIRIYIYIYIYIFPLESFLGAKKRGDRKKRNGKILIYSLTFTFHLFRCKIILGKYFSIL